MLMYLYVLPCLCVSLFVCLRANVFMWAGGCMCVCLIDCVCLSLHMLVCVCICLCACLYVCVFVCVFMRLCALIYLSVCVLFVCLFVCMCVCVCVGVLCVGPCTWLYIMLFCLLSPTCRILTSNRNRMNANNTEQIVQATVSMTIKMNAEDAPT